LVPSHPIFNEPLKVNLTFEDRPTPGNYPELAGDVEIGKTIEVWPVQTKKFPEIDPGLVSNPYGFDDSPDTEVISSGLNSKGPDSLALARQGNFFLWGFSASPRDMMPEARKCFVNAVCYIKKFDGRKPIVRKRGTGLIRAGTLSSAYYWRRKAAQGGFEGSYPDLIRERFGNDPAKYLAWVQENLEYLRFEGEPYRARPVVDEDVKSLGLSNRKVELLDRCVSMLERGDRPDLALRILKRYTTEGFSDAKQWRSWLAANRHRLFFTDVGGFKFLVALESQVEPSHRGGPSPAAREAAREPDAWNPVEATAELTPAKIQTGETLDFVVRVKTAPTWHIYATERSNGPGVPTTLTLRLPKGIEAETQWSYPKPIRGSDGQMIYEGTLEFRRRLRVGSTASPGRIEVTCEFTSQACDSHSCRLPTTAKLVAKAEVVVASPRP
jgi:hypothetical protein